MRRKIVSLLCFVLTLFTTKGQANINGSTLQSFNPTSSNGSFVTVQSAQVLKPGQLNIGGFLDQAKNTLPPALDAFDSKFEVSNEMLSSELHFAVGVIPNLEVGANVGYILNASVDKDPFAEYYKVRGLTDFRINTKLKFFEKENWHFAANLIADFPQIENDQFYGSGDVPLYALELITSVHDGQWAWGANLGYNVRPNGPKIPGGAYEPVGDTLMGSLALAHQFLDTKWTAVGELWGAQPTQSTANYSRMDLTATEILLGAKFKTLEALEWQAGLTHGTRGGISTPDNRIYLGVNYLFELWRKDLPPVPPVVVEAPAPKPAPVPVRAPEVGNFVISTINFKTNSAEISSEYASYLRTFATFVRLKPSYKSVTIRGYTDSTGTKEYNLKLSLRRANAIRDFLVKEGRLSEDKMITIGFGIENPIATNKSKEGRQLNRRIELLVEE